MGASIAIAVAAAFVAVVGLSMSLRIVVLPRPCMSPAFLALEEM